MSETTELRGSWLAQRLERPVKGTGPLAGLAGAFSFGGGLKNGGLNDKAMALVREVWSFDYMGASEYEWGAVPEALGRIAKADLTRFEITVPIAEVPKGWRDKSKTTPTIDATIYVLCPRGYADEIGERIGDWARGKGETRDSLGLTASLRPFEEWDARTVGWLELDTGFLFFTDKAMWANACDLFGVDAAAECRPGAVPVVTETSRKAARAHEQ